LHGYLRSRISPIVKDDPTNANQTGGAKRDVQPPDI
jgi:hypothetical protein